eukprot:gnl/MRDRNA2_/MRDRNA2_85001_c0_seq1.p1 gnl/MRDRNA2_/MRDRNA2_85001_c0~~gnl/MRDRNA2_/MRDRNA2_85001_c0_seq1.p1  ORF type:complete len:375 (+),score=135.78 gnl/MRDRNA2_/MRDRNA2_85001_c0_seq1:110-1234(+)
MASNMFLALAFVSVAQAALSEADQKAKAMELQKEKMQAADAVADRAASLMASSAGAQSLRKMMEASMEPYLLALQEKEIADKENREKRWAAILHKQQQSLLQHEQAIKTEEKEVQQIQREKEWKKAEAAKQTAEVENCAGQQSSVRAFIAASDSHASCLKSQLGACITSETLAPPTLKCDEPSAGWQKKCLAEKAQEMADCAPLGVDWNAMRQGEEGNAADNAALQRLGEWCGFHRALSKINEGKDDSQAPFSLILSKDAALSKDAVRKLNDFGLNFKQQEWDLLQVDPIGTPAALHSVLVKTDAAEKLQKAMAQMKAVPLDKMPKAVNDAGLAKAISWTAGVSGMLERESSDCSLQSPALLKPKEGKLEAALR